ncbi:SIR2 family protein [Shimia thalassica]|uniref:SIR2 family protein n=1 Tax=Shimia thalassica TaxID=1715693 RepID=UPI001C09EC41|nr:SIR2 family protein [Shimia thalassica]MBU2944647.1 SIR2 family protein [Shimia thalassica]MDO6502007.1 SIR2 family protein [Shimia thalassica]
MSNELKEALLKGSQGKAILFCGAGASLDSIGFDCEELPAASPLLSKFNEFLGKEFTILEIAAAKVADNSSKEYFRIITDCFKVQTVSIDTKNIMLFPWNKVYSTNYDDSIEIACEQIGKPKQTLTAKDKPSDILQEKLPIIHLHGFVNHFRIDTIRDECILDYDSNVANRVYEGPWATELKNDISTADVVVFLGYSLYDPEIAKLVLQGDNSRKKIFFINYRIEDEQLNYKQQKFGTPLHIEKDGLASVIEALPVPTNTVKRSFVCFKPASQQSIEHRSINYEDLTDLFLFGRIQDPLLQADIVGNTSNYIIRPSAVGKVKAELDNGSSLISLYSPLGHGKTVISKVIGADLAQDHDVFFAVRNQDNFIEELRSIVASYDRPIVILDDYYKFSKHHREMALLKSEDVVFIFTSRLNVHETRKDELPAQFLNHDVVDLKVGELNRADADALVPLTNQVGMWRELSELTDRKKAQKLISTDHSGYQANFADILVGLMNSSEMIGRIRKELEILKSISRDAYDVVLLSIYLEFTNNHVDDFVIDQTLRLNLSEIHSSNEASNIFRVFFNVEKGSSGYFAGSIFAKYAMEKICDHNDLIGVIEKSANNLADSDPLFEEMKLVLVDLLRFNYLKAIAGQDQSRLRRIGELYSNLSSNSNLNKDDLFWNAFGMCKRALKDFDSAIKHFRTSISYAKNRGRNYIPYHAQNQLIVCLLERGTSVSISSSIAFSNLKEVFELLSVQADDERTYGRGQAFAWHKELVSFLNMNYSNFDDTEKTVTRAQAQKYVAFIIRNVSDWENRPEASITVKKLQSFLANNPM